MALREHLRELRNRVLKAALGLLAGALAGWFLYDPVLNALAEPFERVAAATDRDISLNLGAVASAFDLKVRVSIFIGTIVSSPVWIYQLWAFITPGLTTKERRYALGFMFASIPLFLSGAGLAYLALPNFVRFLVGFTPENFSNIADGPTYLGFVMRVILSFGLAFMVPMVLVGLNMLGLLPGRTMLKAWRWVVVIAFTFAAIATPTPDVVSMFMLALPLLLLFGLAIGISLFGDRQRRRRRERREREQEAQLDQAGGSIAPAEPIAAPATIDDTDDTDAGPDTKANS